MKFRNRHSLPVACVSGGNVLPQLCWAWLCDLLWPTEWQQLWYRRSCTGELCSSMPLPWERSAWSGLLVLGGGGEVPSGHARGVPRTSLNLSKCHVLGSSSVLGVLGQPPWSTATPSRDQWKLVISRSPPDFSDFSQMTFVWSHWVLGRFVL